MLHHMKAITLRNLPPEVARRVEEKSRELGLSLNKTVARLLEERLIGAGKSGERVRYDDLDWLAGSMSPEEAEELSEAIAEQRQIDEDLWR
jgi:hypothetical protein